MECDESSIFQYDSDGEGPTDSFSLTQLRCAVSSYLQEGCHVQKLAEGSYHKVYDIRRTSESHNSTKTVVRVACPAFPTDKLESEVATMQYLAAHSTIPVPQIYAWNSNASNPVGAEYMIMEKVLGCSAHTVWDSLTLAIKVEVVKQVARHYVTMFSLRFEQSGSLYRSGSTGEFSIGPIVSPKFFKVIDGVPTFPEPNVQSGINRFRGPYLTASDWLSSHLKAEMFVASSMQIPEASLSRDDVALALEHMERAVQLCLVYPGNHPVLQYTTTPAKPFSFRLDDFSLTNFMIYETTGQITGLIDFEATTIVPLWECARIPEWLQPEDDPDGWTHIGGTFEEKGILRAVFLEEIDLQGDFGIEWRDAYENGRLFRQLLHRVEQSALTWKEKSSDKWVQERLQWAKPWNWLSRA